MAEAVAHEALSIQEFLVGTPLDAEPLITAMVDAFRAEPDHGSMGRSAPARLERAMAHADAGGLDVPTLRELAARLS
jgi:hypothetical protein